jgi:iron complex transport system ATP-binding protein
MNLEPQGHANLETQGHANLETQGHANLETQGITHLETQHLELGYEQRTIVSDLNLCIQNGKISTIIGANGCGKSTILRALARLLKPKIGSVLLSGKSIQTLPSKTVAQQLAILPQAPTAPEGITVEALVQFGRYPHQKFLQPRSSEDNAQVESALEQTKMQDFRNRPLETLSGGQRQRAWIAMALAQNTPLLLLDEPTTYLDIMHQLEVLHLLEELNAQSGKTIIMVLHDLNQAARYSHELIAVKDGRVVAQDTPKKVLNHALLREVFGLEAHILPDPSTGKPHIIPYALAVGT